MEGWLTKKGSAFKTGKKIEKVLSGELSHWKLRYFRLSGSNLLYYEARLLGVIGLEGGVARRWENQRISAAARETSRPHKGPDHLRALLRDLNRYEAFAQFCASIHSCENLNFYMAVERFRKIPDTDELQLQEASRRIFLEFVRPGAAQEISAPLVVREQLRQQDKSGAKQMDKSRFDRLQNLVLQQMKVNEFPLYMAHSAKKSKETVDLKIKTKLTKEDMKKERCDNCAKKFSLMTKRGFCRYCNDVFCNKCLTKQCALPDYGVTSQV